jgi:hypothetical protein
VRHRSHDVNRNWLNWTFLVSFSIAFGFVEAAVAYYLRIVITYRFHDVLTHYKMLLDLGFISFVRPTHSLLINCHVLAVEMTREAATIIMLLSVGALAGRTWRQRIGGFLVSFACWDIAYYAFFKIIDNWPASFLTRDVFFLIPVAWIGPVITPLVISTLMLVGDTILYVKDIRTPSTPE